MFKNYLLYYLTAFTTFISLTSCNKVFENEGFTAYFGGEILNPQDSIIIFLKDGKVIDTITLDKNNRFLHKFDSLTPGLYTFQHTPEYQYIYFDKNDSLMIRLNTNDFDNSLSFCGRGDEKNNYLINQFLLNENERNDLYELLDQDFITFSKNIDANYNKRKADYLKRRAEIGWSENFDKVAKAGIDLNYYFKKELYPFVHQYKTGESVHEMLPKDYYDFRKSIDFKNVELANFSPFIKYVTSMLNNLAFTKNNYKLDETSLDSNIYKLNVTDSLIKNKTIKNVILNNIAYMYLLQDQNMCSNTKFFEKYLELSTDVEQQNEVRSIYNAVQNLNVGKKLPEISLVDKNFNSITTENLSKGKETVIFFWSTEALSHFNFVHKKVESYRKLFPNVQFIGVNINDTNENWVATLNQNKTLGITELKSTNFAQVKEKWVITKIHRTIILNPDGSIKNAFANLLDVDFGKELK